MSGLFGHGAPTSLYMALYLSTWVVHLILAGAVVGGAVLAAIDAVRGGPERAPRRRVAALLRGDLPLLLGLAITAGVAPLLFVQILYRQAFYTASLLMHVRFLAILPALLACFYLLYLGKTERGRKLAPLIYGAAALCALFVGYSFAELHSLAIEPAVWVDHYAGGRVLFTRVEVAVRHLAFLGVAAAATSLVAVWAGRWRGNDAGAHLAPVAIVGLVVALLAAGLYGRLAGGGVAAPTIALAVAAGGAVIAAIGWGVAGARRDAGGLALVAITAGTAAALAGIAVAREAVRAARLDLGSLAERHAATAEHGGAWLFALFVIVNGAGVAWCISRAWRASRARPETASARETR